MLSSWSLGGWPQKLSRQSSTLHPCWRSRPSQARNTSSKSLAAIQAFEFSLYLMGISLFLKAWGFLGFSDRQKRELLGATHIGPYQKSNPLLALLSSSAQFSPKTHVLVRKQLPEGSSLVQVEEVVCGELPE